MAVETITENVYLQTHDLSIMGCKMGRNVTVITLQSGNTLIHSTADFSELHIAEIRELGEPGLLFEATNFHDTSAMAGRISFPKIPYLVPQGFPAADKLDATEIDSFEFADDEVEVIKIQGIPKLNEICVFHRPSGTLIIADLFFNLPDDVGNWTKWFLKTAMKIKSYPGQSAFFQRYVEDEAAYRDSLDQIMELDFKTIIPGHGTPILNDAKAAFKSVLLSG